MHLPYGALNGVDCGPSVGTKEMTNDLLIDRFKVNPKNLPRVLDVAQRVLDDAAKAGFHVGEILLCSV
jgi:hypothetical protein